ncbi:MAG: transposase [Nitrosomonadaceae bacterium]|nr:transposase [Nitrosomonadaceae bacterium]
MAIATNRPGADNSPGNAALRRGRYSEPNRIYLVTACTHHRAPLFQDWRAGRLVVAEMRRLHELSQVESLAWVVMPDHWHWLLQLGEMIDLAQVMNVIKGRSAMAVNRSLGRTGPVWQRGYHDHALRHDEDVRVVARYVIANPVRAGLVAHVGEYPLWDAVWCSGKFIAPEGAPTR